MKLLAKFEGIGVEHRLDMIKEDAHMIMDTYFMGLATNNIVLLAASRSFMEHVVGQANPAICEMFDSEQQVSGKVIKYAPYNPHEHYQPYVTDKSFVPGS